MIMNVFLVIFHILVSQSVLKSSSSESNINILSLIKISWDQRGLKID